MQRKHLYATAVAFLAAALATPAFASSHREAPMIAGRPQVDGTDFYMFRSYEPGRETYVTLIANYLPLQDVYGGPSFFYLDPNALYEIHVDNNGDAKEDITFQFRFKSERQDLAVRAGGVDVPVALVNIGQIGRNGDGDDIANLNRRESYELKIVRGDRRKGDGKKIRNADTGENRFMKPADRIGDKSLPDHEAYARNHVYNIDIPGCQPGRVFVGQRAEPFFVNLAEIFDLVNVTNPLGAEDAEPNVLDDKNITSLVLEVPISCLVKNDPVIGAWTTSSVRVNDDDDDGDGDDGKWRQVSRLSAPLVNEVVIGLKDKDRFNGSEPKKDGQFATYVTNPTLPELLEILFGTAAPNLFPRTDLVAAFLTGINTPATGNLNQPANVVPAEMMRLNTSIGATPTANQKRLGVIGGDLAGFPNGRRPGDDVVDIELRVAMGRLISLGLFGSPGDAPSGNLDFTDGAFGDASMFDNVFPYLRTPISGSPNPEHQ